ncbi:MAG: hypothetical protein ACOX6T_05660 [Myxococcales bacterium]|jgi:hypothetical protein
MRQLLGAMAAVGLLVFVTSATAQTGPNGQQTQREQQAQQQAQQEHTLTGRVLKADRNMVIIEYENAAIPFQVQRDTEFRGVTSAQALREGQEVRASYELKNNRNMLKSLEFPGRPQGAGGAGEQDSDQRDSDSQQPRETY